MGTGATLEQIEAAKLRIQTVHGMKPGHPMEGVLEVYADLLVPPDHRIIRADENRLSPELWTALATIFETATFAMNKNDMPDTGTPFDQAMRVLRDALAESES